MSGSELPDCTYQVFANLSRLTMYIHKISKAVRLLFSSDPRDQIRLRESLNNNRLSRPFIALWRQNLFSRKTSRDYIAMQKKAYDRFASADIVVPGDIEGDFVVGSWREHNEWRDYSEYLLKYVPSDETWVALDYGCGPGRNIARWSSIFERVDGVDISATNLHNAQMFLKQLPPQKQPNLFVTEGMDCGLAPKLAYDFVMSTICLQHICVYDVRYSIFQSIFQCLKAGGRFSAQMGFGVPSPASVDYYDNYVQAANTNRGCDVAIACPSEIRGDLERVGFINFEYWIRPTGPGDCHPNWIFFTAVRPALTQ